MKTYLQLLLCFFIVGFFSGRSLFAQKDRDFKKENYKSIGRPGDNYTFTPGTARYNPKTGKYEPIEGEWKQQPEEYHYDPKEWSKPKHKKAVYGNNPFHRLFKIKPKAAEPGTAPPEQKKDPFTTGEDNEKKK